MKAGPTAALRQTGSSSDSKDTRAGRFMVLFLYRMVVNVSIMGTLKSQIQDQINRHRASLHTFVLFLI